MRHLFRRTAVVCALCAAAALVPAGRTLADSNYLGICITPLNDYDALKLFADAVKNARGFRGYIPSEPWTSGPEISLDANGWPLSDANIVLFHGASDMQGTYALYFTPQNPSVDARAVDVSFAWGTASLGSQAYDAATNVVRYNVQVSSDMLLMNIYNTNGGVKNVKFMRPLSPGSTSSYDTSVTFTAPALAALRKFQVLRPMHCVNPLSDNMVAEWADRTPPGYCCHSETRQYRGGSTGAAWEYLIQLCNETDADLWANIPFLASDDYVRQLALLIQARLEPERKVYTEYSNEVWNSWPYDGGRNHDSAVAEVNRGGSPLNFDGEANDWYWAWRRTAKRAKEISDIFRSVFGDNAMMTRVRPLIMTQQGNGQASLGQALTLMMFYYDDSARVANPHPPSYYFYGAGGAAYYSPSSGSTVNTIWTSGQMDTANNASTYFAPDARLCATMGLKRVAYEGGPGLDEGTVDQTVAAAAWADSRMTRAVIDHHTSWSNYGGDLCAYFTLTGWGSTDLRHTFLTDVDSAHTPKMNAIDSLNARSAAAVTFGTLPPCSIDGDSAAARFTPLWDPPSACRPTEWFSYIIRVEQPGTYGVTVDYTASATGAVALLADGQEVGAPSLTSGTHTTAKVTAYFEPGLHGIIVRVASLAGGRLSINQVNVSVESLASQPMRAAAIGPRPSLRSVNGRLTVRPGRGGWAEVCTLDGRVLWRGEAQAMTSLTPGSGVFLLRTQGARGAAVVAR